MGFTHSFSSRYLIEPGNLQTDSLRDRIDAHRDEILAIADKYHLSNVRIFGSVARDDDGPDSDIDLLVDVDERGTHLSIIGMEQDVQSLLGVQVDIVPAEGLKSHVASTALLEAVAL